MSKMFYMCEEFNQPLNWDTSSVTDMSLMFYYCTSFNQNLNWDTSSVINMNGMFSDTNGTTVYFDPDNNYDPYPHNNGPILK